MSTLLNFVGSQLVWFACVLGAANGSAAVGPAVGVVWLLVHVGFSKKRKAELAIVLAATVLGSIADTVLVRAGTYVPRAAWPAGVAPIWFSALWAAFATTLGSSTRFITRAHPLVAAALGAAAGPIAYLGGARLGALELSGTRSLLDIAIAWALLLPLLSELSRRLHGDDLLSTSDLDDTRLEERC